ncbi:hypothetical protein ABVK25_006226 [Lepraria finkii]|uniref:Uncharacterized protein n=1 Tax=Lepraria finkii TaxID=1340010 RepID=A0ABR4BCE5_9LECA
MAIVRSGRKKALAKTLNRMVRNAQAKVQERTNSALHLASTTQKVWNKQCKQDRCRLRAQVSSAGRGGILRDDEQALLKPFKKKTEEAQTMPASGEGVRALSEGAELAWGRLRELRSATLEAAGVRDYVDSCWGRGRRGMRRWICTDWSSRGAEGRGGRGRRRVADWGR